MGQRYDTPPTAAAASPAASRSRGREYAGRAFPAESLVWFSITPPTTAATCADDSRILGSDCAVRAYPWTWNAPSTTNCTLERREVLVGTSTNRRSQTSTDSSVGEKNMPLLLCENNDTNMAAKKNILGTCMSLGFIARPVTAVDIKSVLTLLCLERNQCARRQPRREIRQQVVVLIL